MPDKYSDIPVLSMASGSSNWNKVFSLVIQLEFTLTNKYCLYDYILSIFLKA